MKLGHIEVPDDRIRAFCLQWKVRELSAFGSVLRDDFRPGSDVDLLVSFQPEAGWNLFDHGEMQQDLAEILGRSVDLVTRGAIEASRNPHRRREIFESARPIFAA